LNELDNTFSCPFATSNLMNLDPISFLSGVRWSSSKTTSALLTQHAIPHGFTGIHGTLPTHAHYGKQVHGVDIHSADATFNGPHAVDRQTCDGIWTSERGACVAVKTADCIPVLLATKDGTCVAAVHAGWRGLVAGILPAAVQLLLRQNPGVDVSSLIACIGPAISRNAFEVGPEVIAATASSRFGMDPTARALTISKGHGDRWHLDLSAAAVLQLAALQVTPEHIEVIQACTKSLEHDWHSYRREGKGCGLNWAWIEAR
jgi:hypothetical protein